MTYDWLNMFTIKKQAAGSTCHFLPKMSGQNLRRVQKRESRARQTVRYHHLAFIAKYTERKYNHIYKEADNFYQELYQLYPNKRKLTTCLEFKNWEMQIKRTQDSTTVTQMSPTDEETTTTRMPPTDEETTTTRMPPTDEETTTTRMPPTDNFKINIPLMSPVEVQCIKDTVMFEEIYPSLTEEISNEMVEQIIRDIRESDNARDIFNNDEYDEDVNDIINAEINDSLNELSSLEKELLRY